MDRWTLLDAMERRVRPETSTNYEVGYRFQRSNLLASVALWDSEFHNRIVSSYDPTTNLTIDRNVGNVRLFGLDAQAGAEFFDGHLRTTAVFSYTHTRLEQDVVFDSQGDIEPLAGKQLVETPQIQVGGRVEYDFFPGAVIGFQGKYTGKRWVTDLNDLSVAGYTVFDMDMRISLDRFLRAHSSSSMSPTSSTNATMAA